MVVVALFRTVVETETWEISVGTTVAKTVSRIVLREM